MAKIIGFKHITTECLTAAFNYMQEEGTCCLAYGDWTVQGYNLLLTTEQHHFHQNDEALDEDWNILDTELCEALIMLPILRNIGSVSLYWDDITSQISTKPFPEASYGVDFSDI